MRSPTLLLIRMNAAETSASRAIADCTPLTVVSRSATTAEIETFISEVSKTRTNIAAASNSPSRETDASAPPTSVRAATVTGLSFVGGVVCVYVRHDQHGTAPPQARVDVDAVKWLVQDITRARGALRSPMIRSTCTNSAA